MWKETFIKALAVLEEQRKYNQAIREYDEKPWYVKMGRKAPVPPSEDWQVLSSTYIKEFNKTHDYPEEIVVKWQQYPEDDKCLGYPVVEFWTYQQGCYIVTRQAFQPDGTTIEWGCPYPESECGLTGRTMEYDIKVEGMKEKYKVFDEIISEIKDFIVNNQTKLQQR